MFKYYPQNVCAKEMEFEIEEGLITNCIIRGGCPGNLLGISKLVIGMKPEKVIELFENNTCGPRSTSCPDQLAKALKTYLNS